MLKALLEADAWDRRGGAPSHVRPGQRDPRGHDFLGVTAHPVEPDGLDIGGNTLGSS